MTTRRKVLITCRQMQEVVSEFTHRFESSGFEVETPELTGQQFTADQLIELCGNDVEAIIAGDDELNSHFFDSVDKLSLVVRWGIGTDSVDFEAAKRAGVPVRNTPGVFGDEVADLAIAYLLMLARRVHTIHNAVVSGNWPKYRGISLSGNTLGIIGFGVIGQAVARRAHGFGMETIAFDPYAQVDPVVPLVSLDQLLSQSRFVVLTCPATPETTGMINAATLKLMRDDAFIVNVGRGALIRESDLVGALEGGTLAGAALDVFEEEPLPASSALRMRNDVVLGAHNASNTIEGVMRASTRATEIVLEVLRSDG